ncbi:RNA polymerase sigma factor [Spirosoma sordidisoli]|uniref:Sigma-70 family RNA polymerase sigma factor n=1 Tax=Spirosoma sordidisoli TaxID=2502893 RepID=A0A4Q2UIG5_9BACT|nr:sigma-70 family RNA polymerase sigma factor [Spirosoma sordidisoli]RYC69227.1 sigma-70 family RNA polymerase sigma factor [Spirosoma sordidisoli]
MLSIETPSADSSGTLHALWEGVRRRDYQSLTNLYRHLYSDLLRFGQRFGHNADTTKDAINQIFLEIWERADTLMPVDNVRSYLITYLRRKLLRVFEQTSRFTPIDNQEESSEQSYEDILIHAQQEEQIRSRLRTALAQLTPRQKELIEMRFFRGMSNEQICQETGMHINTVYNTLSSALKTLRQTLSQAEYHNLLSAWPLWLPVLLQASDRLAVQIN